MSLQKAEAVEYADERCQIPLYLIRLVKFLFLLFDDVSHFQRLFILLKSPCETDQILRKFFCYFLMNSSLGPEDECSIS